MLLVGLAVTILVMLGVHNLDPGGEPSLVRRSAVPFPRPIALPDGGSLTPTVKVSASRPGDDDTVDSAIARADEAMYAAKQSGKDQS